MGSKVIWDSQELLDETLVTITEACDRFPIRCSRPSIERWLRIGSRGAVLESVLICGKRYTSVEAINRFVRNQLHVGSDKPITKRKRMAQKDIIDATCRYGLPEPLTVGADTPCQSSMKENA